MAGPCLSFSRMWHAHDRLILDRIGDPVCGVNRSRKPMWRERFTSSTGANAPVDDDLARGHSVVAGGLRPPWVSRTEAPIGNPSPTSGARVAWVRCSPSQAAGRRRIAYVRPPRRSPLPTDQRACQSSGDGAGWSMGVCGESGDNLFGGMVNGTEMVAGRVAGNPAGQPCGGDTLLDRRWALTPPASSPTHR